MSSLLCDSKPSLCFGFRLSIIFQFVMILTINGQSPSFPLTNYIHKDFQGQDQHFYGPVVFSKSSHLWNCQKATMEIQNAGIH